jgi:arginase
MSKIRLILVPYELGRLRDGVGRGPEHLVAHGAAATLEASGESVRTTLIELEGRFSDEIEACFELIRLISIEVADAIRAGAFPVVLSGSCFASIGVVAGLAEESPGVLWFDAHGDFNEPNSSVHGYFDGMGLAVLTGSAWQGLMGELEGSRVVQESAVVLAGARDLDPPEVLRLEASELAHPTTAEIAAPGALKAALDGMSPEPSGLYVHVDLDVLDPEEAHVNIYEAPGGLSADALVGLVEEAMATRPVRALSLTAYDPDCDVAGAVPPIALRLLETTARRG